MPAGRPAGGGRRAVLPPDLHLPAAGQPLLHNSLHRQSELQGHLELQPVLVQHHRPRHRGAGCQWGAVFRVQYLGCSIQCAVRSVQSTL